MSRPNLSERPFGHRTRYSRLSCPLVTFNNKATRSNLCVTISMDRVAHVHILKTYMNIFYSLITLITVVTKHINVWYHFDLSRRTCSYISLSRVSTYFFQFNFQKRWACVDSNRLSEIIDYLSRSGCYYACNNNVVYYPYVEYQTNYDFIGFFSFANGSNEWKFTRMIQGPKYKIFGFIK